MDVKQVAAGTYLITEAHVNCYLLEEADGVTLIDAGLPAMRHALTGLLAGLGRSGKPLQAIVLTHGHFDHVGMARWAQQRWDVPVYVHGADQRLAAHPYSYKPQKNRLLYPFAHPRSLPVLGNMALHGALTVKGVSNTRAFEAGTPIDVPGRPVAIHTPGHTDGHCILHLPERGIVFSGDALVTFDPYTGIAGPQIVASAATNNTSQAMASLQAIEGTGAQTLLSGHGEPWDQGAVEAVTRARQVGEH